MYDVFIINNGIAKLIHTDNLINKNQGLKILNAKIIQGINTINSFTFELLPNNPRFNELFSYKTKIIVRNNFTGKKDFYGRVLKSKDSMESDGKYFKNIECEDRLGYLCDTLVDYLPEQYWNVSYNTYKEDGSLEKRGVLEYVLGLHNSKQPLEKRIYIGNITVNDTDNQLYYGMQQQMNAFETLKEKLVNHLGGELLLREDVDGKLFLDYQEEIGEVKSTKIALRRNMQKLSRETDPTTFVTRLYPLGAKVKKTIVEKDGSITEVETDERITCAEANNGIPYVDDELGIATYGIIEGYKIYDHVVYPSSLLNHGKVTLRTNNKIKQKFVVSALDLSIIGLDIDTFEVGNYYPIENNLLKINISLRVTKKTININSPEASQLEIGDKYTTLTELQLKKENETKVRINQVMAVGNTALLSINKNANYLASMIDKKTSSIADFSDEENVKVNIKNVEDNFVDKIKSIEHIEFNYENSSNKVPVAYDVEQLRNVDSNFVIESNGIVQPNLSVIIPLLTKTMKELITRIETLERSNVN